MGKNITPRPAAGTSLPGWLAPVNVAAMQAHASGDVASLRTGVTRPATADNATSPGQGPRGTISLRPATADRARGVITLAKQSDDPTPDALGVLRVTAEGYRVHADAPHLNGFGDRVCIASLPGARPDEFRVIYTRDDVMVWGPSLPGTWDYAMDLSMWSTVRGHVRKYA